MVAKRSTKMGKVMPYVDVREKSDIPKFESMLKVGPVFVLVYADWCGHCQRFKDKMWNEVANSPNKAVNTAAVHYNMVDKTSMRDTPIEGYPTLFEVKPSPKKNVTTPVPTPQTKEELEAMVGTNSNTNTLATAMANAEMNEPTAPTNANQNNNMRRSEQMMKSSQLATNNTFVPEDLDTLPPNTSEDMNTETNPQALQQGGSLLESLLKVSADAAHAIVLTGSAIEISRRLKQRKSKKRRSSKKQATRRRS